MEKRGNPQKTRKNLKFEIGLHIENNGKGAHLWETQRWNCYGS
jgi:hypothetical protein